VHELTENTLDQFFEARGLETGVEFTYVTHNRVSEDPQAPGLPDPHTHVILPGTYFDEGEGRRVPLFFSRNKQVDHIELLHLTTEQNMVDLMDRYVGPDWEQRYDALEVVREQQCAVVEQQPPDGEVIDADGRTWPVWAGIRRTTEELSAAGIYRYFPTEDGPQLEFRPFLLGMSHEMAEPIRDMFAAQLHIHPDPTLKPLETLAEQICAELKGEGNSRLGLEMEGQSDVKPDDGPSLDL
jgi:hypothetical protein